MSSERFDTFWLLVTKPLSWIWLLILSIYLLIRYYQVKKGIYLIILSHITCLFTLLFVELIKRNVARFRPIDNHQIKHLLRIITDADNYSFVSGHSAFSMTFALLLYKLIRKQNKYAILIFIFPLLFAYSRLYLGVHFLTDIVSGFILGYLMANIGWFWAKKKLLTSNLFDPSNSQTITNR